MKSKIVPLQETAPVEELLRKVAHDSRGPLGALLLWVRLLRSGQAPDREEALAMIEQSATEISDSIEILNHAASRLKAAGGGARSRDAGGAKRAKRVSAKAAGAKATSRAKRPAARTGSNPA